MSWATLAMIHCLPLWFGIIVVVVSSIEISEIVLIDVVVITDIMIDTPGSLQLLILSRGSGCYGRLPARTASCVLGGATPEAVV